MKFNISRLIVGEIKAVSDELIREACSRNETVPARFVITGSHNYLLADTINESLVGRVTYVALLSLTTSQLNKTNPYEMMYKGGRRLILKMWGCCYR